MEREVESVLFLAHAVVQHVAFVVLTHFERVEQDDDLVAHDAHDVVMAFLDFLAPEGPHAHRDLTKIVNNASVSYHDVALALFELVNVLTRFVVDFLLAVSAQWPAYLLS